ncbi:DUF3261 domain-containing protein [Pseudomonas sp. ABC1]|uniref:DUF3261 domain-containing protein n=1 Tax=Pseudomonas sp. ABC1 TaxID=2748080 RepID=UPI0015C33BDD|nr:DUF3261 domain-containing protein [Pseudomonas sp. ABC1]QLF95082.1 DUF3261 domain-containing protein [Pseudomonas sp. ABC1]
MMRYLLVLMALLLTACANHTPLPERVPSLVAALPLTLQIEHTAPQQTVQQWLLVLQREDDALRYTLLDPLGTPLARQRLRDGSWHNDGLLPPNPRARELFGALLFALTPDAALAGSYPTGAWSRHGDGQRQLAPGWRIDYRAPLDFTLRTNDDLRYHVRPMTHQESH